MSSSSTRLAPDLTNCARLPSGVIATAEGVAGGAAWVPGVVLGLATDTVPTSFTLLPSIDSMLTESSARFATSASVPARLIAISAGCRGLDGGAAPGAKPWRGRDDAAEAPPCPRSGSRLATFPQRGPSPTQTAGGAPSGTPRA